MPWAQAASMAVHRLPPPHGLHIGTIPRCGMLARWVGCVREIVYVRRLK